MLSHFYLTLKHFTVNDCGNRYISRPIFLCQIIFRHHLHFSILTCNGSLWRIIKPFFSSTINDKRSRRLDIDSTRSLLHSREFQAIWRYAPNKTVLRHFDSTRNVIFLIHNTNLALPLGTIIIINYNLQAYRAVITFRLAYVYPLRRPFIDRPRN